MILHILPTTLSLSDKLVNSKHLANSVRQAWAPSDWHTIRLCISLSDFVLTLTSACQPISPDSLTLIFSTTSFSFRPVGFSVQTKQYYLVHRESPVRQNRESHARNESESADRQPPRQSYIYPAILYVGWVHRAGFDKWLGAQYSSWRRNCEDPTFQLWREGGKRLQWTQTDLNLIWNFLRLILIADTW